MEWILQPPTPSYGTTYLGLTSFMDKNGRIDTILPLTLHVAYLHITYLR